MNLLAAALLIGQVGAGGGEYSPPASGNFVPRPTVVDPATTTAHDGSSPATVSSAPAAGPSVNGLTSGPARPGTRVSFGDAPAPSTAPATVSSRAQEAPVSAPYGSAPLAASAVLGAPATPAVSTVPATSSTLNNSPESAASLQTLQAAAQFLADLITVDPAQPGLRRMPLVEALSHVGDVPSQSEAIDAYWGLFQAIAHRRFAAEKMQLLSAIPQPAETTDRALVDAALFQADAEEVSAEQAVLVAQYRLLRASAAPWDGHLPWPIDPPLVSSYRTNFETYYAQRSPPLQVRFICQALPNKLRLVEKRFNAVAAAEAAVDAHLESLKRNPGTPTQLVDTIHRLGDSRRSLIAAVVDYNGSIAEYSLATVGAGLGADRLVSTLIKNATPSTALANVPRVVRQTNSDGVIVVEGNVLQR